MKKRNYYYTIAIKFKNSSFYNSSFYDSIWSISDYMEAKIENAIVGNPGRIGDIILGGGATTIYINGSNEETYQAVFKFLSDNEFLQFVKIGGSYIVADLDCQVFETVYTCDGNEFSKYRW